MTKSICNAFALLVILGCFSPKLEPLDFVDTVVWMPEFENFNGIKLKGQILHQGITENGECGFLWSYDRITLEGPDPIGHRIQRSLPPIGGDGMFEATLDGLERERTIYIRTFVVVRDENAGERHLYSSKTESFTVGQIVATMGDALILNNNTLVYGQLRGITGKAVEQYGHVISKKSNESPTLTTPGCIPSSPQYSSFEDHVFQSEFYGLEFNTTYLVRAYAIAYGDTFYSSPVDTFRVRDGWEKVNSYPYSYAEGTASVIDEIAYAGFGCKKALGCLQGDLVRDFWKFDPTAQNGMGEWTPSVMISDAILKQYNNVSFVVAGKFHAIFGEYYTESGSNNLLKKLLFLTPNTSIWSQQTPPDSVFTERTGAVAFTLKGKAYVGAGRYNNFHELNDFWEYDPTTYHWRQVASLPLQKNPTGNVYDTLGRYEAVAFTLSDQYAYVGAGQFGNLGLRDFWRFNPPDLNHPLGEWEQVAFLPPEAPGRYEAVAMSINGKGYVGTGYNPTLGYLNDWWEYDSAVNKWYSRTPLPAQPRTNAMGFAIGNRGYLGTGHTKIMINGGLSSTEDVLSDFWRYVPEE